MAGKIRLKFGPKKSARVSVRRFKKRVARRKAMRK